MVVLHEGFCFYTTSRFVLISILQVVLLRTKERWVPHSPYYDDVAGLLYTHSTQLREISRERERERSKERKKMSSHGNSNSANDPRQPSAAKPFVAQMVSPQDLPVDYSGFIAVIFGVAGVMFRVGSVHI